MEMERDLLYEGFLVRDLVRYALLEDFGYRGDITTRSIVPCEQRLRTAVVARGEGILSGTICLQEVFRQLSDSITIKINKNDGDALEKGSIIANIEGLVWPILSGERVMLNFLSHLSGIATQTFRMTQRIKEVRSQGCFVSCTRKTTPLLRYLEKEAVQHGGGLNHRFGLGDAVLIKDNHLAACGGSIREAVKRVRRSIGHMVKVEIEADHIDQVALAVEEGVDGVLLDNMPLDQIARAVSMVNGRVMLESSGNVTLDNVQAIAKTGVDVISSGALTHSAPVVDIALDFLS